MLRAAFRDGGPGTRFRSSAAVHVLDNEHRSRARQDSVLDPSPVGMPRYGAAARRLLSLSGAVAGLLAAAAVTQAQEPELSFTVSPDPPIAGKVATLTPVGVVDNNREDNTKFVWSIDGRTVTRRVSSPVRHTFSTPGTKQVTLTVDRPGPNNDITYTQPVEVIAAPVQLPPPQEPPEQPTDPDQPPVGPLPLLNRAPTAAFAFTPRSPGIGAVVEFVSGSYDPDGDPLTQVWDLDGDNQFDDAAGARVTWRYRAAGAHRVRLRVTDPSGAVAGDEATITPSAGASSARFLIPFPVVGLTGRAYRTSTQVKSLAVRAPRGTLVTVRCSGRGCSRRSQTKRVGAPRRLTFPAFHRRLRVGSRLSVSARRSGYVGKYTRFRFRAGKAPARVDRCLVPGSSKPRRCPTR